MKRPPVRLIPSLLALAAIPLLILLVNQMLARGFDEADSLAHDLEQSQRLRDQLNEVLSLHQDMETGQRGYVVTGDPLFLEPYERGRRQIEGALDSLEALGGDGPSRAEVLELRRLSTAKTAFNDETVALARRSQAEATRLVATGRGREAMDRLRVTVAAIGEADRARIEQHSREAEAARRSSRRTAFLLQTLLIVLLVLATWSVGRAIAEQRRVAARHRDSSIRQEAIFQAANDGMVIHDRDGVIESHNRAVARLYGYGEDELVGRAIDSFFETPPTRDELHYFLDHLTADPTGRASRVREYRAIRKDGTLFDVDAATSLVPLEVGARFLVVLRDATGRKEVERMKAEFVSTVSHELRTPLTSIAGSLGLIAGGVAGTIPDKAKRLVDIAHANSERLVRLVNDLLDMERLEAGKVRLALEWVRLVPLLSRAIDEMRGFADRYGVDVALARTDDKAIVVADPDRLQQVFVNLISNAVKFSPAGAAVELELVDRGQHHRICVSDRGPGIDKAFRSRIFGKFAQADSPDVRARGGTGLGLSIAREIVTQLGGAIGFEDRPGGGTTFFVDLPAVNDELADPAPADALGDLPAIIHVDDDPDTLRLVASAFEGKAEILSTPSVREGLAALDRGRFDAAILDIEMADGSGLDLLPRLREAPDPIPIIVYSVHEPDSSLPDTVDAVLVKSRATLDQLVAETLARIGGRRKDDR